MNVEKALIFIGIAIIILAIVILFCHLDDKYVEKQMNNEEKLTNDYYKEQEEKSRNLMENQKEIVKVTYTPRVEAINNKEIFNNPIDTVIDGIFN